MATAFFGIALAASQAALPSAGQATRQSTPLPIQQMVEGVYISRFPEEVNLTDEQFVRALPILRRTLQEQQTLSNRRANAVRTLSDLMQRGAGDEEIRRLIQEVDQADAAAINSQRRFLREMDPLLSPQQQARLRLFQTRFEQNIRQMIDTAVRQEQQQQQQQRQQRPTLTPIPRLPGIPGVPTR